MGEGREIGREEQNEWRGRRARSCLGYVEIISKVRDTGFGFFVW